MWRWSLYQTHALGCALPWSAVRLTKEEVQMMRARLAGFDGRHGGVKVIEGFLASGQVEHGGIRQ